MKEEKLIKLIHKRLNKELTKGESQELKSLLQDEQQQTLAQEMEDVWEKTSSYKKTYQPDVAAGLGKLKAKMRAETATPPKAKVVELKKEGRRSWLKIAAAAAILIVGGWFAWDLSNNNSNLQTLATTDISQSINLSDGSEVALNKNSQLQHPTEFAGTKRNVKLQGEAFFEVTKNPEMAFVIDAGDLEIKVLGTSFNVRNYANEDFAKITVRSGSVEVSDKNGGFSKILKANDQLVFDKRRKTVRAIEKDEHLNDLAWWSGKLTFQKEKVSRIKEAIEQAYEVKLNFTNSEVLKCKYTITNDVKAEGLEALLEGLKLGLAFDSVEKIKDREYQLVGGKCNF